VYEMLIAIGIAVVLVVAALDRLAARIMMGPEEMALLRLARAAPAQRRLVASAAQQEREARAAAAQSWSGKREPQQPSAASWRTGRASSSSNTKPHSRHRSQRVSVRSSLNSKHGT
jgi:hypothetical protein